MRIMEHNAEIIKSVKAFKGFNERLSEIVSEDYRETNNRRLDKPLYCGEFIVKIYKGNYLFGIYKFDCKHWRNFMEYNVLTPRITKIK